MEEVEVNADKKEPKQKFVVRTLADLQRLKLEKLMKNPDKPMIIPEHTHEKDFKEAIPSFVRNVMGSSAGAGSGEFHVYRHLRRKEYARQKCIQQKSLTEQLDQEYRDRIEKNKEVADAKTAKKRAKRLKRKQKMRNKGKKPKIDNDEKSEDDEDSDNDDDNSNDATEKNDDSSNADTLSKDTETSSQDSTSKESPMIDQENHADTLSKDTETSSQDSTSKESPPIDQENHSKSNDLITVSKENESESQDSSTKDSRPSKNEEECSNSVENIETLKSTDINNKD